MAKNVHSIIDDLKSGLSDLESYFQHLGLVFGRTQKSSASTRKKTRGAKRVATGASRFDPYKNFKFRAKKTRKKMTISPARKAQMKLQGRYMALVKHLPKAKQAQVKKVRKDKGYEAALKMMV